MRRSTCGMFFITFFCLRCFLWRSIDRLRFMMLPRFYGFLLKRIYDSTQNCWSEALFDVLPVVLFTINSPQSSRRRLSEMNPYRWALCVRGWKAGSKGFPNWIFSSSRFLTSVAMLSSSMTFTPAARVESEMEKYAFLDLYEFVYTFPVKREKRVCWK